MALEYHFPGWAEETIGSASPAEVGRWFAERGCELSDETWRKFLGPEAPNQIRLETWAWICEASGSPLSAFVDYRPDGRRSRRRTRRRRPRRTARATAPSTPRLPRSAAEFFGGDDA